MQIGLVWAEVLKCGDGRKRVLLGVDLKPEASELLPSLAAKRMGSDTPTWGAAMAMAGCFTRRQAHGVTQTTHTPARVGAHTRVCARWEDMPGGDAPAPARP